MRGLSCGEMGGRHAQNAICGEVGAGEGGRDWQHALSAYSARAVRSG